MAVMTAPAPLTERHPLSAGVPPRWASEWGQDGYGVFVAFTVGGVTQRLRWIRPGRFLMGSPEDEPGRYDYEGPLHEVAFRQGFWLFDTACTKALWTAVMGKNPSRYEGLDRPVGRVGWEDCQVFLEKINDLVPGLGLTLPTEAQWEYACRAGTTTPFSFGDQISLDQVKHDSKEGGPAPVSSLPANPWGLYEMHGNVWEWCADHWHENYVGAPTDGSAWLDSNTQAGSRRVLRGGSWISEARLCRSAYRGWFGPGDRIVNFGFRCARGQEPAEP